MISHASRKAAGVLPTMTGLTTWAPGFVPFRVRMGARRVVPIDGGVREVRHRVVGDRRLVELQIHVAALHIVGNREGAVIERPVMDPRVAGEAVESEVGAELRPIGRCLPAGQIRAAPKHGIDVQTRQSGGPLAFARKPSSAAPLRHGNSAALVLDKALLHLLKVQMDTPLEVTTDGKNIINSPQTNEKAEATLLAALERINQKHGAVLSRLGK